jgi:predicted RNase H-like HicB family nuclease
MNVEKEERETMVYRVVIQKGEDFGYVVHCPAIPGCHSQGSSIEEAIENIKDAIRGCLSVLGEELMPEEGKEIAVVEVSV